MADWYVSSAAYAAIPQFAASTAYTIGQIVRPLTAPAIGKAHTFRCTTGGTSSTEPTWPTANNSTITTGGATFTNVTGQSTYGWGAAAGDLYSISQTAGWNRPVAGDRVFLSSDHSESLLVNSWGFNGGTHAFGLIQIISVNRAGSVPPVPADIQKGAALTLAATGLQTLFLEAYCNMYWQGITFTYGGTPSGNATISFNSSGHKGHYFKDCAFVLGGTSTVGCIGSNSSNPIKVVFDNTTVQFNNVAQFIGGISSGPMDITWINTPAAIQGTNFPTTLFNQSNNADNLITCRGVDLSAAIGTLMNVSSSAAAINKVLLDSCKIAAGVARMTAAPNTAAGTFDEIELVNCHDGTNVINERHTVAGDVTTDRSTYMTGGAQDDVGNYSIKLVSSSRSDFTTMPIDAFAFDIENIVTGVSKTATIEIISSGTLNNTDIKLQLQYMGTSGNSLASFNESLATVLATPSALPSSSSPWNSPPGTPQKQLLQVSFTPQRAGRVRGLVRLGKPSTTVWVNPQIAIV